jgi:prolyl oligopeptidase PreP (S9A serine peptidase family)
MDCKEEFQALYGYSPYHHAEDHLSHPAVLLFVCSDKDGVRVD